MSLVWYSIQRRLGVPGRALLSNGNNHAEVGVTSVKVQRVRGKQQTEYHLPSIQIELESIDYYYYEIDFYWCSTVESIFLVILLLFSDCVTYHNRVTVKHSRVWTVVCCGFSLD